MVFASIRFGLRVVQVKSFLIYGENLEIGNALEDYVIIRLTTILKWIQ
jgi:hypothetical protein|nr:MAG TPA: hypothetical protein [Caudoviricetes sp.]